MRSRGGLFEERAELFQFTHLTFQEFLSARLLTKDREKSLPVAILWTIAMMTLGFFTGSLYAFIALQTSGGDWRKFWLGKHA